MLQPPRCSSSLLILLFLLSVLPADGQTAGGAAEGAGRGAGGGAAGGGAAGGGADTIQVVFTPTICKVLCRQNRCVNSCQKGNVTSLSSDGTTRRDGPHGPGPHGPGPHGPGFRVFVCPLLCQNGGVCLQADRCRCPAGFTGRFCQIPYPSASARQEPRHSEFLLPLAHSQDLEQAGAHSRSMVTVRVQHPPEATVNIHGVMKLSGSGPALWTPPPSSLGSVGAPAPAGARVQAQTIRGGGTYTQQSDFKYCFREVKDGQCSSPLPGLRSREMCCKGIGKAWGITDCVLCPDNTVKNESCPAGFQQNNGTECVDVDECLQLGRCENGLCVNTRGSYSCVCQVGFILDATHGICISQSVISEERGQCHRVLGSGLGPSSCSLPILKKITKQICCCSRVGKAWGPSCERCPHFGSAAFKEICPAGPGYHYSASALQFNQRADEQLGSRGAQLVTHGNQDRHESDSGWSSNGASQHDQTSPAGGSHSTAPSAGSRVSQPQAPAQLPPVQPQAPPQPPSQLHPLPPVDSGSTITAAPRGGRVDQQSSLDSSPSSRTKPNPQPASSGGQVQGVCESRPGVCGHGLCVDQPSGTHTCVCEEGFLLSSQRTHCQDVDECLQSPCNNGHCDNTPGSFRCVCDLGYKLRGNTCTDMDECLDPLQCPGQECVNTQGSYRCISCRPGYSLLNRLCTDIDECRQAPCSNGYCDNTPGSYRCICHHGYKPKNSTCTDIDECAEPFQCPGQMCVNSMGSYRCVSCRSGYTLTNRLCTDINECEDPQSCPGQQCVNTNGSYSCVDCASGYQSVNSECTDVDECEQGSQCPGQQCVNTVGSYRCVSCAPGFSGQNGSCQDVDECVLVGVCEAEQLCVNTPGSFRCDCAPGYRTANLGRCRDVNECLEGDFCFSGGECVNTPGSFMCVCSRGFILSHNKTACLDVDECVRPGVCSDGSCVNTDGSFRCVCHTGFTTNPEKTACLDVDECVSSGGSVCVSQRCENTIGSYHCLTSCEPGYQRADSDMCADVDECVSQPGVCGLARCVNVPGSFLCVCDQVGHEFNSLSRECVISPADRHLDSSSSSSSSSPSSSSHALELPPLPPPRPGELRECYYHLADQGTCSLLATNTSQQECCCTVGEGWGLGCQYLGCPPPHSVEFLSLCPSGRGYITAGGEAFSYRDVDECKRFQPEVCKNGVCVNNIPGYSCYCSSGYVYNSTLLECVDHDECEEESCVGGVCVNTVGSYYCSCQLPLVLDDTQRNCVNSSHLTVDENLSVCWQHVSADLLCQSPLLGAQVTFTDCCCLYGEGWGMGCALCPPTDSDDYASLCSSFPPPRLFQDRYPDTPGSEPAGGAGGAGGLLPPYGLDFLSPPVVPRRDFERPDYEDYSPAGGSRTGFRGRTPTSFSHPDDSYRQPDFSAGYFSEGDLGPSPEGSPPRLPTFRLPPDPRAERGFGVPPPPASQPDGPALSLAPLPGARYEEESRWRLHPPVPPYSDRTGAPRRVYERRYESYGLSTTEDCGILHGCENGRCIRVAEGYTCDCYSGYQLDMTSMTCIDINECEDVVGVEFPCVNARCVNTDGSFRCVCRRGYVMSRRTNHCVAA